MTAKAIYRMLQVQALLSTVPINNLQFPKPIKQKSTPQRLPMIKLLQLWNQRFIQRQLTTRRLLSLMTAQTFCKVSKVSALLPILPTINLPLKALTKLKLTRQRLTIMKLQKLCTLKLIRLTKYPLHLLLITVQN